VGSPSLLETNFARYSNPEDEMILISTNNSILGCKTHKRNGKMCNYIFATCAAKYKIKACNTPLVVECVRCCVICATQLVQQLENIK
jgi:hypothetical protein